MKTYEPEFPHERHKVYAPAFHEFVSKEEVLQYLVKFVSDENMNIKNSHDYNYDDYNFMYDLFLCTPYEDMTIRFGNYLLKNLRNELSKEEYSKIVAKSFIYLYTLNADRVQPLIGYYVEIQKKYPPDDFYLMFRRLNEECRESIVNLFNIKQDLFLIFPKVKTYIAFS